MGKNTSPTRPTLKRCFASVNRDAQGFDENRGAAKMGGRIARNAREELEQETGKPVISKGNYLGKLLAIPEQDELLIED